MSVTDDYLANNARYAEAFSGPLPLPPSKSIAVLACMDARLDVAAALGIAEGESHVIRNAGGVASDDAIRSLAISQRLLGTREIVLVHHTDCGMLTFTDEQFAGILREDTGVRAELDRARLRRPGRRRAPLDRDDPAAARSCRSPTRSAASSSTSPRAPCARSPTERSHRLREVTG